jgi:hypothetical protein
MVLPDEALTKNLLGVSFLSRLKRYEYANGAWCSNSRQRLAVSARIDLDRALCVSPAVGYWIHATLCLRI